MVMTMLRFWKTFRFMVNQLVFPTCNEGHHKKVISTISLYVVKGYLHVMDI
jgi:hypothetical protein